MMPIPILLILVSGQSAEKLEKTYRTRAEIIIAGLSRTEGMKTVEERTESLDRLDLLINNAGYWEPGFLWEQPLGEDFSKEQRKWMKPEEVVDHSLRALEKGRVRCIPGFRRRLIAKLINALPRPMYHKLMHAVGQKSKKTWDGIAEA